ncbi:MFS transporter [Kineococcus sp. SYSU DK003]|uniref:MFS transporter n=1 Tax=Kineococcus sp. SYSU DK003 TaxID=3383124 RepID=UPI003D7C3757
MTTSAPPASIRGKFTRQQRKAIVAGSIGNAVEFVDWAVYATFSSVFAAQFFPGDDPTAALLSTLLVFAVGFVMRPVGSAVLGHYADRHGRKAGLTLTIGIMAGATALIAVTPSYATIGVFAPILLLLARLAQGFSAGGEFGASSAFLVENAAQGRRAFAGSWQQVSVGAGVLVASLMGVILTNSLSEEALASWGWRVAFGVGALLGLVGLWLRVTVEETESFSEAKAARAHEVEKHNPLVDMVTTHRRAALRVAGITIAGTLTYYIFINYMPTFARTNAAVTLSEAFLANTIAVAVFLVLLPFGGMLSDKIGRKATMTAFAAGFVVFAWPAFHFIQGGGFATLLVIELVGVFLLVGYSANCAVVMAEQFPPEVRTTGIGLPYALAVAVFGGTAPYVTTWMSSNGYIDYIWIYVAVAAAIGVVVYTMMPETKDKEMA